MQTGRDLDEGGAFSVQRIRHVEIDGWCPFFG